MRAAISYTLAYVGGLALLFYIVKHAVVRGIAAVIGMLSGRGTGALAVRVREDTELALVLLRGLLREDSPGCEDHH